MTARRRAAIAAFVLLLLGAIVAVPLLSRSPGDGQRSAKGPPEPEDLSAAPLRFPPAIAVTAVRPGAKAKVVAETVAAPIEQQVNGVENMMYMPSQCTNDGTYTLTVTFKLGTDLNIAQVLVQNRVSLAQPVLPPEANRIGSGVKKKSSTADGFPVSGWPVDFVGEDRRDHRQPGRRGLTG